MILRDDPHSLTFSVLASEGIPFDLSLEQRLSTMTDAWNSCDIQYQACQEVGSNFLDYIVFYIL
jgi:hypothetical protein